MKMPKYRRHSSGKFAFVEINGERPRLPGGYDSDESWSAYHRVCADIRATRRPSLVTPSPGSQLAIVEAIEMYLDALFPGEDKAHPGGTYMNCCGVMSQLKRHFGSVLIADFGPKKLDEFIAILKATPAKNRHGKPHKDGRTLTRTYVNIAVGYVKAMFRWLVRKEIAARDAAHALESVSALRFGEARENKPRRPVTFRQFIRTTKQATAQVRAMLLLQWLTGARAGSVCQAKPEQFDTSITPWVWNPRHKTEARGRDLILFIGPKGRRVLRKFLAERKPDEYLFSPRALMKSPRFRARYHTATYNQAIGKAIGRANKKATSKGSAGPPIPHWTSHQIRHAKGHSVRGEFGLEAAQAVLGHDSIKSTQIYSDKQLRLARHVAEAKG